MCKTPNWDSKPNFVYYYVILCDLTLSLYYLVCRTRVSRYNASVTPWVRIIRYASLARCTSVIRLLFVVNHKLTMLFWSWSGLSSKSITCFALELSIVVCLLTQKPEASSRVSCVRINETDCKFHCHHDNNRVIIDISTIDRDNNQPR